MNTDTRPEGPQGETFGRYSSAYTGFGMCQLADTDFDWKLFRLHLGDTDLHDT